MKGTGCRRSKRKASKYHSLIHNLYLPYAVQFPSAESTGEKYLRYFFFFFFFLFNDNQPLQPIPSRRLLNWYLPPSVMILAGAKRHRSEGAAQATEHPPSQLSALLQPQQQGLGTGQTLQCWFPFPAACCTPPAIARRSVLQRDPGAARTAQTHGPFTETAPRQNKSKPPRLHMSILRLRITCEHENPSSQMLSRDKNSFPGKKWI